METYSDFVVKNCEELELLSDCAWWTLKGLDGEMWMVRGKCVENNENRYSVLLTDLATVFFASAGTSQIAQEASVKSRQDYNPNVKGDIRGIIKTLDECLSCNNYGTSYIVKPAKNKLKISKLLNDIYYFKWIFSLKKVPVQVRKI